MTLPTGWIILRDDDPPGWTVVDGLSMRSVTLTDDGRVTNSDDVDLVTLGVVVARLREHRASTRANCWNCALSGPGRDRCYALTLDEETDKPILDWLEAAPMADDGTVPRDADGCPGWEVVL